MFEGFMQLINDTPLDELTKILKEDGIEFIDIEKVKSDIRLKRIKDHFKNISIEEFEENLIKCGIDIIQPCNESNIKIQ